MVSIPLIINISPGPTGHAGTSNGRICVVDAIGLRIASEWVADEQEVGPSWDFLTFQISSLDCKGGAIVSASGFNVKRWAAVSAKSGRG